MTRDTFTYLLDHPESINDRQLVELQEIIRQYPYLQSARALELKALKARESHGYNQALKKAAVHSTDRDILFQYITSPSFKQNAISQSIKQQHESVYQIEVIHQDVGEELSKEIDRQLKAEVRKAEALLDPGLFEKKGGAKPKGSSDQPDISRTETVKPDQPLDFKPGDRHSFSEWLKLSSAIPIQRDNAKNRPHKETQGPRNRKLELIDRFIKDKPRIDPTEAPASRANLAEPFNLVPDSVMTETLARVYVAQKNYQKAIQAYNILILKYPEKSGFFADQIRAINKLINNN